jgi:MFS family permease
MGLTLAHVGSAFTFAPLLSMLAPLRAEAVDPAHKSELLSQMLFWGALVAGLANVGFGAVSDRTCSPYGRRRPWMLLGLAGASMSLALIAFARTPMALLLGVVAFQFTFNALYAPLTALFADRVPDHRRGLVAGLMAIGYPVGSGLGALALGRWLTEPGPRFMLLAVVLCATILPFALRLRDPPTSRGARPEVRTAGPPVPLMAYRDFGLAFGARFLVQTAFSIAAAYGLFYVQSVSSFPRIFPDARPEAGLATLSLIFTAGNVAASLGLGWLSDRLGGRRLIIGGAAIVLGSGMLLAGSAPGWAAVQFAWLLLGLGLGAFIAVESALAVRLLPTAANVGRDLGVLNLANALPQCIAPLLGWLLLRGSEPAYGLVFAIGGVLAFCAVGLIALIGTGRQRIGAAVQAAP